MIDNLCTIKVIGMKTLNCGLKALIACFTFPCMYVQQPAGTGYPFLSIF